MRHFRHFVFINKGNYFNEIKLYGSIKAVMQNETIIVDQKEVDYNRLVYLLRENHELETKNFILKRCDVVSTKKVIKK